MNYEPMDVDVSNNSEIAMDISYETHNVNCDSPTINTREKISNTSLTDDINLNALIIKQPEFQTVKKYHITIKKSNNSRQIYIVLSCLIITFLSIIGYQILNIQCYNEFSIEHLKGNLHSVIYGQREAIDNIIRTLESDSERKILFLYGGTGVGKTYTVSILLANAWNYSNIYHYTMPSFKTVFSTDMMIGLTICKSAILVVDDINYHDIYVKIHVKSIMKKSEELGRNVTVILIYNYTKNNKTYDSMFSKQLLQNFSDVSALKQVIRFESLTADHLKKCIEHELGDRKLNEYEFQSILKNFNVMTDGCKGVYKKMHYLNIV
ncbi:uncharacterized protein LOC131853410 [Achroia grisella]|uniref:uncharacterized protein LOC131853410 n=1 Tax=Achroia grisella TaxID=688607 RepID=UPI0027D2552E|nr:uncharacterized protein LOC131853410 [Achroia grisella]